MKKQKPLALYYRLMRLCALILLPVFLISFGFSQYAIVTTQKQQSEYTLANLKSSVSKTEQDIDHVLLSLLDMRENLLEIKTIARRYPDYLSGYELGTCMNTIQDHMTRLAMNYDLVNVITVYWPGIQRATSLSRCYSDSFTDEYLQFADKIMQSPDLVLTEGPYGSLEICTLGTAASPYRVESILHATVDTDALISKVKPAAEGAVTIVRGDTWSVMANSKKQWVDTSYQSMAEQYGEQLSGLLSSVYAHIDQASL